MNILYIINNEKQIVYKENIYILPLNNSIEFSDYDKDRIIELMDIDEEKLKLGKDFSISYRVMKTARKIINKYNINKIVFACKYIDAYFTMQYLTYGGEVINQLEVYDSKCEFTELNGNLYKFPYYWIRKTEARCKEMIEGYKTKEIVSTSPKLSIIIPYYNLGKYICETIDCIRNCSYKNYEIIIVNDGTSENKSKIILDEFRNQADITIVDQENKGLSEARNIGASYATSEYITFLDADDLVEKDYYQRAISVLENHSNIDIVYSWVRYFESKNEVWPTFDLSIPYLLLSNMSPAFYIIRKTKFIRYGINRKDMRLGMEDYDSLINMCSNGCKGVAIPEPLVKYRYRLGSMSKSFNPNLIVNIYNDIINNHKEIYEKNSIEILKLINANGPGYLWNNPTLYYPSVCLNSNEDINDVKYLLINLMNTRIGRIFIKILKNYKNKKNRWKK